MYQVNLGDTNMTCVTSGIFTAYLQQQGWVQGLEAGLEVPLTDKGLEPQPSVCPSLAESALWPPKPRGCSSTAESAGSASVGAAGASLRTSAAAEQGCRQTLGCLKESLQPEMFFQNLVKALYSICLPDLGYLADRGKCPAYMAQTSSVT